MNDIIPPENPEQPPKQAARVNLFERLREAKQPPKKSPPPTAEEPPPAPPAPQKNESTVRGDRRIKIVLGILVGLVAIGVASWLAVTQLGKQEEPKATPSPSSPPSPTPTPRPSPKFSPSPVVTSVPPAVAPQPGTYTVQPGDTLITIGEKLQKDWHVIAAANGNIPDPNLIYPGQVLKIP